MKKDAQTYEVRIGTFPECVRGEHGKCAVQHSVPSGQFGGSKCNCPCHNKKPVEIPKPGIVIDHNGG